MSNLSDSDVQNDVRTFSMYQRLRKINPYAYYSLRTQKQMQSDLRIFGSPAFFEQDPDDLYELDEPTDVITLSEALSKAESLIDIGSPDFSSRQKPYCPYSMQLTPFPSGDQPYMGTITNFAAMIALMHEQSLQLEVDEYNTSDLRVFGYSMSFMKFLAKAEARYVLNVMMRTQHKALYCVSEGVVGSLGYGDH